MEPVVNDTKSSRKGKRKARSNEGPSTEVDSTQSTTTTTTVYVSGLPKTITSQQLTDHASLVGPVRSAFVVVDKVTNLSRGFGYIRYVLRSDAEKAINPNVEPQSGMGEIEGYKISVKWAKKRLAPHERRQDNNAKDSIDDATTEVVDEVVEPLPESKRVKISDDVDEVEIKVKKKTVVPFQRDPASSRTVVLQGLPPLSSQQSDEETTESSGVTVKQLYKKGRKFGTLEKVTYPAPTSYSSSSFAHLIYTDPNHARTAREKLHDHVFKGFYMTTALKSKWDAITRLGHAFGGRLIVRNLDFNVGQDDLRVKFASLGPVQAIDVPPPTKPDATTRNRGFAFVWYLYEEDAKRAIEQLNGKVMRAGLAQERIERDTSGLKKSVQRKQGKEEQPVVEVIKKVEQGRVMAVDWALSKKKFQEAEGVPENEEGSSEGDEEEEEEGGDDDVDEDDEDDLSPQEVSASESGAEDEAKGEGVTLFVRNLSFEATEDQLYNMFRAFGPLRYARIAMDPKTKRSRGTAFVCFWKDADAQRVLELGASVEAQGSGIKAGTAPSLIQADPSSTTASALCLQGRVLGVSAAVSREEADRLREDRDKKGGTHHDKRNLYLMREGVIFANSYEAKSLHADDVANRQASFDQRKSLLRSNASLYISKTRLAIRQIPLFVSDLVLKRLARHALNEWRKEVKAGSRKELSRDELVDDNEGSASKRGPKASKVVQSIVLRDKERMDGVSGHGRSKGCGFVEMTSHADTLRVLRWANGNAGVVPLLREWAAEELDRLISRGSRGNRGDDDDDKARVQRMEARRRELQQPPKQQQPMHERRRTLIIELATENAQTVQRRHDRRQSRDATVTRR